MVSGCAQGLTLGLSTGAYCLAACVPALLPYTIGSEHGGRGSLLAVVEFAAGRILAYLLLGIAAATLGSAFAMSALARTLSGIAVIAFAVVLLVHGLMRNWPSWGACERLSRLRIVHRYPALAGLALGLNACPPLLLCLAAVAGAGSVLAGVAMAAGFGAGTLVFLIPLAFTGAISRWTPLRRMAEVATLFGGLFYLCSGIAMLTKG